MVVHGERIHLGTVDGWFVSEDDVITGLVTYRISGKELEILSLDSLVKNRGIGTSLLNLAINEARDKGCIRIMVITTELQI